MKARSWPLKVAEDWPGRKLYADAWAVEKLAAVVHALAEAARVAHEELHNDVVTAELFEAYRNTSKLACWMAGDTQKYSEAMTEATFDLDELRGHTERMLGVWEEDRRG